MANFGSSLAKFAGAGLLQYGQFKYQEQLDAMREANLAKREAARMAFEKEQRSEDRALRERERGEDRALRGKERAEDMQLTREQMAAQDAKWRAQFEQQDRHFSETMGYKRVEDLNGAFDAAQKKYEDTIARIGQIELEAGQSPDTPPDFAARVTQAKAIAKAELLSTHASLFDANPEMAKRTRYWGGDSYKGWLEAKDAGAKALTDSLLGGTTTTPPPAAGGTDKGNSREDADINVKTGYSEDELALQRAQETPAGLLARGAKGAAGAVADVAVSSTRRFANAIAWPATQARIALTTPINQDAAALAQQIQAEADPVRRQQMIAKLKQLQQQPAQQRF